jgi:hypothetical protein
MGVIVATPTAMAAGTIVELNEGTPQQSVNAPALLNYNWRDYIDNRNNVKAHTII